MIPWTNATLTAIRQPGTSPDWDQAASGLVTRWSGDLAVYVADEIREDQTGLSVDELLVTRVEVPWQYGRLIERGDTLEYTDETGTARVRQAETITGSRLVGRVRVLLRNA